MHRRYRQILITFFICICTCLACADAHAAGRSFTVQLGAFSTRESAGKHHVFLRKGLPAEYKAGVRIEKTSNYYVVRLGKSLSYPAAAAILKKVKPIVKDAFIIKQPAGREVVTPVNKAVEDAHPRDVKTKKGAERPRSETQRMPEYINLREVDSSMASFLEEKDYHKAVKFIEKAISQSPREPALYSWYGSSLIASNRPYQALQQFRKAAELAPRKPEYQNGIGYSYVYITIDAARQSIEAFRKVLLLDPDNVDALEGLGAIYASVGEKRQASSVYRKLAEKDKDAAKRLHALMSNGLGLGEND